MLQRDLGFFLIVGSLTVMVDFAIYEALLWLEYVNTHLAKGTSFVLGTTFAYLANRFVTFGNRQHAAGTVPRFLAVYAVSLCVNVGINATVLALLGKFPYAIQLAFLTATAISACMNFCGMKWYVFTPRNRG